MAISKESNGKFRARVWYKGVYYNAGTHDTNLKATRAYNKKRRELVANDHLLHIPEERPHEMFSHEEKLHIHKPTLWDKIKGIWGK